MADFARTTTGHMSVVNVTVRRVFIRMIASTGFAAAVILGFMNVPGGFIPDEDQGYFRISAQLPNGAILQRAKQVMDEIEKNSRDTKGARHVIGVASNAVATL